MRNRTIAAVLILLLALVGTWYVASPYWTLRQIAAAAKADDAERLSSYVDYPALRTDLKEKLTARLLGATDKDDPTSKLGRAMGMALMAPMVDAFLQPKNIKRALQALDDQEREGRAPADTPGNPKSPDKKADRFRIERLGLNSLRVSEPDKPGSGFVFERRGLGWKLAGIDLPANTKGLPSL